MKVKLLLSILVLVLTFGMSHGQDYKTSETVSSKLGKLYNSARDAYKNKDYTKAIDQLDKAISAEPLFIDAHLLLSEIYYRSGNTIDALRSMNTAMQLDSAYDTRSILALSRLHEINGNYSSAAAAMTSYLHSEKLSQSRLNELRGEIRLLDFRDSLVKTPVAFDPIPLAGEVNTSEDEALPIVSIDGNSMIFTRRSGRLENLFISWRSEDTDSWGQAVPIARGAGEYNEGAHAISADGRVMAYTACNRRDAVGSCDIYMMILREDGSWTRPANLQAINTPAWEGQPALSSDGRTLYFSSDRTGGLGKRDIWVSHREPGGDWSTPVNLGNTVNTAGNESSPYLHYDDRSMYFMSDGHPGMGDYDIFLSTYSEGNWSTPVNLGYPINTPRREGALTVDPDSRTAYYTMQTDEGTMDIFTFDLPEHLRPKTVSYLTGKVFDLESNAPLQASIRIFSIEDTAMQFTYLSNSKGRFDSALPHDARYGVHVESEGYAFYSDQYTIDASAPYDIVELSIGLTPLSPMSQSAESTPIVLSNVEFQTGSAELIEESVQELRLLNKMLRESSDIRIEIRGHTDNVGDPSINLELSMSRAQAVYQWLSDSGIDSSRMNYIGFGQDMPIDTNATPEGRQRNRRVEFVILR